MPKFRSWLGALNYYVLQWFFVRLTYIDDPNTNKIVKWLFTFQIPLTGWDYSEGVIKAVGFTKKKGSFFRNGKLLDEKSLNDFK